MAEGEERCPACGGRLAVGPVARSSTRDAAGRRTGGIHVRLATCGGCGRRFREQLLPRGQGGWREVADAEPGAEADTGRMFAFRDV